MFAGETFEVVADIFCAPYTALGSFCGPNPFNIRTTKPYMHRESVQC